MNNNNNSNAAETTNTATSPVAKPAITSADVPLLLKARYFGSGMVVGVFISPAVRKTIGLLQPKLGELVDTLTGQAEGLVGKSSDLVAKAKDILRRVENEEDHTGHGHA